MMDYLERSAARAAMLTGARWVDDYHLLLALLNDASPLGERLRLCSGADESDLVAEYAALIRTQQEKAPDASSRAFSYTPHLSRSLGRAEGLALARGAAQPSPAEYLAAILADPGGLASAVLSQRPALLQCLRASLEDAGIPVPAERLSSRPLAPGQDRVSVPDRFVRQVLAAIGRQPPAWLIRAELDERGSFSLVTTDAAAAAAFVMSTRGGEEGPSSSPST